jgi:hypothetical protein
MAIYCTYCTLDVYKHNLKYFCIQCHIPYRIIWAFSNSGLPGLRVQYPVPVLYQAQLYRMPHVA